MKKYILFLIAAFSVIACGRFGNKAHKQKNKESIICISKQYSEIIFALGAQKNIVAVDLSSTYPNEIKKLPTVGYHRALSAESILAFKPTLILHDDNIGPDHVVGQLEKLHIPMKTFGKHEETIDGTYTLIRDMGNYFGKQKVAESLCDKLKKDMSKVLKETKQYTKKPKVLIIHYGRASNVYLVMTKKSTAAKMIEWSGGKLAVQGEKGMKHLSPEVIAKADPDIILLTDFGYSLLNNGKGISKLPGISSTKAFKNKYIFRVEEHDLVYLGPRTGENVLLIQKLIHPNENQ